MLASYRKRQYFYIRALIDEAVLIAGAKQHYAFFFRQDPFVVDDLRSFSAQKAYQLIKIVRVINACQLCILYKSENGVFFFLVNDRIKLIRYGRQGVSPSFERMKIRIYSIRYNLFCQYYAQKSHIVDRYPHSKKRLFMIKWDKDLKKEMRHDRI
jgi:hypothetical protein